MPKMHGIVFGIFGGSMTYLYENGSVYKIRVEHNGGQMALCSNQRILTFNLKKQNTLLSKSNRITYI